MAAGRLDELRVLQAAQVLLEHRRHELPSPDGSRSTIGTRERQQYIDELAGYIANFTASGPFWPGDNLIDPSSDAGVVVTI
jgi:hypothetical protein